MNEKENSFLDKNTILAIALSIVFFIGWQFYVQKKYPPKPKEQAQAVATKDIVAKETSNPSTDGKVKEDTKTPPNSITAEKNINIPETTVPYVGKNLSFSMSSKGMGFSKLTLNSYSDREEKSIVFGSPDEKSNFATLMNGVAVPFIITKESETAFVGHGENELAVFEKRMEIDDENFNVKVSMKVQWKGSDRKTPIETFIGNKVVKADSSLFLPAYEGTEFFTISEGNEERERIDVSEQMKGVYKQVTLASIGSQYFTVSIQDQSDILPTSRVFYSKETQFAEAYVLHSSADSKDILQYNFMGFAGPKKYDVLVGLNEQMPQIINYGVFTILSKPILSLLKWLYGLLGNWGFAIIVLTIFIRMLLLPINISSFRSMKKMQKIQPQLKAIKEKYKDDPAKVNQETMALMKQEKANPLGGCLPMLLQLPVFFALYSVLGQSVELYKSPFIFWIHDLSFKDPYFVLPIGVAILYFIQMNLTPTQMDPTQAKIMKFIPILFGFFMISVPSGLTLYFFVNTIFGIGQQLLFHKERQKTAA